MLVVYADRRTKTRMRQVSASLAFLNSVQDCPWNVVFGSVSYTIKEDIHKLKFISAEATDNVKGC